MPNKPSLTKGLIAGAAAGVLATIVMDQFQNALTSVQKSVEKQKKLAEGESPWLIANEQAQAEMKEHETEGSTDKVARRLADAAGTSIPKEQIKSAGQAVHYSFGTLMGTLYGATAEYAPVVTSGGGTAFATALFIGGDEIAVPALRLSAPPTEMPASSHVQYWAAHLVYGATLELTRNLLRRLL